MVSKGKTESAVGMAVRAIANHHKVLFAQFLKDGTSSEIQFLSQYMEVKLLTTGTKGIVLPKNQTDDTKRDVLDLYNKVCLSLNEDEYNLLILDEILVALDMGLLSVTVFKRLVAICKEKDIDMYLTGRIRNSNMRAFIREISDSATDAYCKKHMFDTYCEKCKRTYPYYYTYCPDCGEELVASRPCKKGRDY